MPKVVRFSDYEKRSRDPHAVSPRNPSDTAVIVVLPVVRTERYVDRMEAYDAAIAPVMGRPMRPGRFRMLDETISWP
jgi:hypothetical protein